MSDPLLEVAAFSLPFLHWPMGVRQSIYKALLVKRYPIACPKITTPYAFWDLDESRILIGKPKIHVHILQTCKQVYREASAVLYKQNHFLVHLSHHQDRDWSRDWGRIFKHLGPDDVVRLLYWFGVGDARDFVPTYQHLPFEDLRNQEFDLRCGLYHFSPSALSKTEYLTIWMKIDRHASRWLCPKWSALMKSPALKRPGIVISVRDNDPMLKEAPRKSSKQLYFEQRLWIRNRVLTNRKKWKQSAPVNGLNWSMFGWIPSTCTVDLRLPFSETWMTNFHKETVTKFVHENPLREGIGR